MNLREIEPPPLFKLLGYLEAVSDFIRTDELKWYFDVKLFEYDDIVLDIALLVRPRIQNLSQTKQKSEKVRSPVWLIPSSMNWVAGGSQGICRRC